MADTEQAPEVEAAPAPATGGRKLLPILLVVAGGLIFGGGSGFFMVGPAIAKKVAPSAAEAAKAAKAGAIEAAAASAADSETPTGETKVFLLDNMVLNPAGSSGQRFLLVSVALRLANTAAETEVKARDAEVRDAFLRVLGTKQVEELSDISQREQIRQELRRTLDGIVKPGLVKGLYFPQFVIQ